MKRRLIVGNWKMYLESEAEAVRLARTLKRRYKRNFFPSVVCPSFLHINAVAKILASSKIAAGAQDISRFRDSAKHTGETSGAQLQRSGVSFAVVGHSEARHSQGDAYVAEKLKSAFAAGLTPILCVGEKERQGHGEHFSTIEEQLRAALSSLKKSEAKAMYLAYEPVWLIGKTAEFALKPMDVQEVVIFIRKVLVSLFGRSIGLSIPILYGAAVETENARDIVEGGGIDGLLVGHASINPDMFLEIVEAVSKVK